MQVWNRTPGRARAGSSGATTVNALLQTLRGICRHAVDHDYLVRNPADRVAGLKKQRRKGIRGQAIEPSKVLTVEQVAQAIAHARPGLARDYLAIAFATGCRPGELQGLRWKNLDLEGGTIHIVESLDFEPGARQPGQKRSKYGSSNADLRAHQVGVLRPRARPTRRAGAPAEGVEDEPPPEHKQDDSPVFGNSLGGPMHRAYLTTLLHEALDAARLPRISLHGCRHTFATNLISKGKQPNEVAALLGHANPRITLERYTHWFTDKPSRETMEELAADIFAPAPARRS